MPRAKSERLDLADLFTKASDGDDAELDFLFAAPRRRDFLERATPEEPYDFVIMVEEATDAPEAPPMPSASPQQMTRVPREQGWLALAATIVFGVVGLLTRHGREGTR